MSKAKSNKPILGINEQRVELLKNLDPSVFNDVDFASDNTYYTPVSNNYADNTNIKTTGSATMDLLEISRPSFGLKNGGQMML